MYKAIIIVALLLLYDRIIMCVCMYVCMYVCMCIIRGAKKN